MKKNNLYLPASVQELMQIVKQLTEDYILIAGGTDLLAAKSLFNADNKALVDLSGISELKKISLDDSVLRIGALCTMSCIAENDLVKKYARCLAQSAGKIGSWQIRSRATLGGNVANASPAADTPVALAALKAKAKIVSPLGERILPVEDISTGPNNNCLDKNEIISDFFIPLEETAFSFFVKSGSRSEVTISRLNLAVAFNLTADGKVSSPGVFMGTLGRSATRAPQAEASLCGSGLREHEKFAQALSDQVAETIGQRSSRPYKQSVARALAQDIISELKAQLEGWRNKQ